MNPFEIIELLETCDELDFNEIIDDLQNYLIAEKEEFIKQNFLSQFLIQRENPDMSAIHFLLTSSVMLLFLLRTQ